MKDGSLKEKYLNDYYGKAEELSTWFNAGIMNKEVAETLLEKYTSTHKVLERMHIAKEFGQDINPHHLHFHRYILMFFGLSLECYLKGLLIKTKKIIPLSEDKKSLSSDILKHLSVKMYQNALGVPSDEFAHTIERLKRAVFAGKYPLEKNLGHADPYTAYFESDIENAKSMIEKAKSAWDDIRFS